MTFPRQKLFLLALPLALTACVPDLGPAPKPRSAASVAATASLPDEHGAWPGDFWWRRYGDPQLDALIDEGIAGSPDIAAAAARLARAQGVVRSAGGQLGPTVVGEASAAEVKQSYNNGFPREFLPQGWNDTGNLDVRATLDLDLWGRNRARLRAALADRDAARVEQAEARITLAASIAQSYADLARLYAERDVTAEALRIQQDSAALVSQRVQNGLDTEGQRRQAAAFVPAARADLAQIDEQIAITRNQIAALIGAGPDRALAITRPNLSALTTTSLPESAGIGLVGRRPDVVAARARVEAAAERIKAAKAAFYPDITLSGLIGLQSLGLDNLLKSGSSYGNVGPALSLPFFDSGRRSGDYRVSRADYDSAVADYDRTLITALQEVANAVVSRNALDGQIAQARAALADNQRAFEIARLRYRAGLSPYLDVLTVEQALIASRRRVADLDARSFSLDVSLVRALGGGFASA